jgi:hypothetical protein
MVFGEEGDNLKPFQKVWIRDKEFVYPAIIVEVNEQNVLVYKYALGIWGLRYITKDNIAPRVENLTYDIYINRKEQYL